MSAWLSVIGIGDDGLDGLSRSARAVLDEAEIVVGGARHLAMLPDDGRDKMPWPSPLLDGIASIKNCRERRVCVLATGDPFNYGVGATLARHIPPEQMQVFPSPSAFALACSRLGWDRNCVETLSVHGRPLSQLHIYLYPGAQLLLLTQNKDSPREIAALLCARGFGASQLHVLEHMASTQEKIHRCSAQDFDLQDCSDLNTVAIECRAGAKARPLSRLGGLPDDAFQHDGQLTKRAVRAATLSALAPLPGELLWDVGAGCASVAIEWMRAHPRNRAIAIERKAERIAMCQHNAQSLGVPSLRIEHAAVPDALPSLPQPNAVFIGGGVTNTEVFVQCWSALAVGGRLVANAVTLQGEQALSSLYAQYHGTQPTQLLRIAISSVTELGAFHGLRPAMPVTQLIMVKST